MRLHPYAPFGILIAVTIGGVALTSTLKETHSSMRAVSATSSIIDVTPKPVVATPKTYYDSAKDECHMRDGSGVLINFAKNFPDHLCDTIFSTYNMKEFAKGREIALVKPGRYDLSIKVWHTDPKTGCQREVVNGGLDTNDKRFSTCVWEHTQQQRANENINNCRAGHYGNLTGEKAARFCDRWYSSWRD